MKENKLKIVINKSISDVFRFTLNPRNTPFWISSIVKEEASEYPPKLGTTYRNVNRNGAWTKYLITSFDKDKMFEMASEDNNYHVKYVLKALNDKSTELEYSEWVDKGELNEPFTLDILEQLKKILK